MVCLCFSLLLAASCSRAAAPGQANNSNDLLQQAVDDHAVILTYHHVSNKTPASTSITPAQFGAHLEHLDTHGYIIWPLQKLVQHLQHGKLVPANTVALTFDDAYVSVFSTVHPMLKARGWPYTVFVATEAIDAGHKPYMDWQQLQQLARDGVELGNHSHAHEHLVRPQDAESPAQHKARVLQDIQTAQERLKTQTGLSTKLFAYPYGEYTPEIAQWIKQAGFTGFGQHSGAIGLHSDFAALPRFPQGGQYTDLEQLQTRLQTRPLKVEADPPGGVVLQTNHVVDWITLNLTKGPYALEQIRCYASGQGEMQIRVGTHNQQIQIKPRRPLSAGRNKYNCTTPHRNFPQEYFWWSYLLMKPNADGSWYTD